MTDLEKLTELLDSWGVPYRTELGEAVTYDGTKIAGESVTVGGWGHDSPKVTGYPGFFMMFMFSQAGGFMMMGAWE